MPYQYDCGMEKKTARQALASNLSRLMDSTPDLDTGPKLAKRAGISQRSISNMTRADQPGTNAPNIDKIEAVAGAFRLEAWQLLCDEDSLRANITVLGPRPVTPRATHGHEISIPSKSRQKRKRA